MAARVIAPLSLRPFRFTALLSQRLTTAARCFACERFTAWTIHAGYYRCTQCGLDPHASRPEDADVA